MNIPPSDSKKVGHALARLFATCEKRRQVEAMKRRAREDNKCARRNLWWAREDA